MNGTRREYYPPLRSVMLTGLAVMTTAAAWTASQVYFENLTHGGKTPLFYPLIWEFTGHYASLLFVPLLYWFARVFPVGAPRRVLAILAHLVMSVLFSVANTTLFFQLRFWIYELFDLGAYGYGQIYYRYIFEFHKTLVFYWAFYGFLELYAYVAANRQRELRTAQLEAQLNQARLDVLKTQINPHFLFNTLNTISSVMYEDVKAADRMISLLSQMLRRTLERSDKQLVALGEEIELLELYLAIMKTRFQEKLVIRIEIPRECSNALVPSFLLQPLVENAIKFNRPVGEAAAHVAIQAKFVAGRLILLVQANGPGMGQGSQPGTGITNVKRRLEHLFGGDQRLEFEEPPGGGLTVRIDIPCRISEDSLGDSEASSVERQHA